MRTTTKLETLVALTGLKRLTTYKWANEDLPFRQMTNLEDVSFQRYDLSIISGGELEYLTKLRALEITYEEHLQRYWKYGNKTNILILCRVRTTRIVTINFSGFFFTNRITSMS
jgi:hypothetical protein